MSTREHKGIMREQWTWIEHAIVHGSTNKQQKQTRVNNRNEGKNKHKRNKTKWKK